jgi:hypothetical protein
MGLARYLVSFTGACPQGCIGCLLPGDASGERFLETLLTF